MEIKYCHDEKTHNTKAAEIIVPYILNICNPKSVIDIGCGIGTWLSVFKSLGVSKILGVDGSYVNRNMLKVDKNEFQSQDLEFEYVPDRKFDLAICLEVAEHISPENADIIVKTLINVSETIIFSAAIPFQGGDGHLNEKWPQYWSEKFQKHGYYFYDIFRDKYWDNKNVEWWYSQNMFLVSKKDFPFLKENNIVNKVHPNLFIKKQSELERFYSGNHSISTGLKFFIKTLIHQIK